MIERKGGEEVDHGPTKKGDFHRAKRIKTNLVSEIIEKSKIGNINNLIGDNRKRFIPKELLGSNNRVYKTTGEQKVNEISDKSSRYGPRDTSRIRPTFKPNFYTNYWVKLNGVVFQKKWKSDTEDWELYDQRNCFKTSEEAERFTEEKHPEKEVRSIEELIRKLKSEP